MKNEHLSKEYEQRDLQKCKLQNLQQASGLAI